MNTLAKLSINMKKILIVVMALGWFHLASAQQAEPTPSTQHYQFALDSNNIMLGDQTVLKIERTNTYPTLDDLTNSSIIALRQWVDTLDGTLFTALTSFEPGEHWYHIGDDSVLITVNDVPNVDTTSVNIRDINNIMRQPYTFGEIMHVLVYFWAFWIIVAAAVFAFCYFKRNKPLISTPQAPKLPADEQALKDLEALRLKQLWQQGKVKEYHTELTDTLRQYLEGAFGIQSTEMTTDQTLEAFHSCPYHSGETESMLGQILQTADMVKFAKSEPAPYQHDLAMKQAVDFVTQTSQAAKQAASNEDNPTEPSNQN